MNRLVAMTLGVAGAIVGYVSLPTGDGAGNADWIGLCFAIVLFWLARLCFVSKGSVIDEFGDDGGTRPRR